jgi:hypothetical protein
MLSGAMSEAGGRGVLLKQDTHSSNAPPLGNPRQSLALRAEGFAQEI